MNAAIPPPGPARRASQHIVGLDAMRCLAALMVLAYHLGFWIWAGTASHPGLGRHDIDYVWLAPFVDFGWVGVDVFFVISGFVICYSAEGATPFAFFRSRFLRLVPAVWVCATITLIALFVAGTGYPSLTMLGRSWLKAALFYPIAGWIDGSYWTLGIEIAFYAVVFLLLVLRRQASIIWVTGVLGLISSAFWIGTFIAGRLSGAGDALAHAAIGRTTDLLLLRHAGFFALGASLRAAQSRRLRPLEIGCVLLFIVGGMLQIRDTTNNIRAESGVDASVLIAILVWFLCFLGIAASVRWNAIFLRTGQGFRRTIRMLGLMTYPLYLVHQNLGYTVIVASRHYVPDFVGLLLATALCVLLAFAVSRYLEPPLRRAVATMLDWGAGRARAAKLPLTEPPRVPPAA